MIFLMIAKNEHIEHIRKNSKDIPIRFLQAYHNCLMLVLYKFQNCSLKDCILFAYSTFSMHWFLM